VKLPCILAFPPNLLPPTNLKAPLSARTHFGNPASGDNLNFASSPGLISRMRLRTSSASLSRYMDISVIPFRPNNNGASSQNCFRKGTTPIPALVFIVGLFRHANWKNAISNGGEGLWLARLFLYASMGPPHRAVATRSERRQLRRDLSSQRLKISPVSLLRAVLAKSNEENFPNPQKKFSLSFESQEIFSEGSDSFSRWSQ
jgi:hypothetical protein